MILSGEGVVAMIHVCSMTKVADTVAATGARSLVTLLNAGTPFERPAELARENHLFLSMNDIVEDLPDMVAPSQVHVETLLAFVRVWDRDAPLVINCFAGVSRSTAAAYITAMALAPHRDEMNLARELRRLSPTATPNAALIRHADTLLGREGRMVAAIESIGRGADAFEGVPFALAIDA